MFRQIKNLDILFIDKIIEVFLKSVPNCVKNVRIII